MVQKTISPKVQARFTQRFRDMLDPNSDAFKEHQAWLNSPECLALGEKLEREYQSSLPRPEDFRIFFSNKAG